MCSQKMNKIITFTLITFAFSACCNIGHPPVDTFLQDSVYQENIITDSEYDLEAEMERIRNTPWEELITQGDINAKCAMEADALCDSINLLTRFLCKNSPSQLLLNDIKEWGAYENAMSQSMDAFFMNGIWYSSITMTLSNFKTDYYRQRIIPLNIICDNLKGLKSSNKKHCNVSNSLLDEAYRLFKDAVNHSCLYEDYEDSIIAKMNDALTTEHKTWKKWIEKREYIASQLNGEVKSIYINSTNELKRLKLIQLLNQYMGYGVISNDIQEHILKYDCADNQLRSYPGFSVVWKSYLDSLDIPCNNQ